MDNYTEFLRGGFGKFSDDRNGMNLSGTIGSSCSPVTGQRSFSFSFREKSGLANRTVALWHDAEIRENPGYDSISKTLDARIFLKLKKMGTKI